MLRPSSPRLGKFRGTQRDRGPALNFNRGFTKCCAEEISLRCQPEIGTFPPKNGARLSKACFAPATASYPGCPET